MGLFDIFANEKREYTNANKKQEHLEKLIEKSVLLFEEKDDYYDKDDYYHYFSMQYFLTPQNNLISQKTTGYRDGHNVMYSSSLVFRQFISFSELNKAIDNSKNAKAKRLEGINEDNCREFVVDIIRRELIKSEENRLKKLYPQKDAWRDPKSVADSMRNIGCAKVMLNKYSEKLAGISYDKIRKLYIKYRLNRR